MCLISYFNLHAQFSLERAFSFYKNPHEMQRRTLKHFFLKKCHFSLELRKVKKIKVNYFLYQVISNSGIWPFEGARPE